MPTCHPSASSAVPKLRRNGASMGVSAFKAMPVPPATRYKTQQPRENGRENIKWSPRRGSNAARHPLGPTGAALEATQAEQALKGVSVRAGVRPGCSASAAVPGARQLAPPAARCPRHGVARAEPAGVAVPDPGRPDRNPGNLQEFWACRARLVIPRPAHRRPPPPTAAPARGSSPTRTHLQHTRRAAQFGRWLTAQCRSQRYSYLRERTPTTHFVFSLRWLARLEVGASRYLRAGQYPDPARIRTRPHRMGGQ